MNKKNYQLVLDKELKELEHAERRPRLLLHACCAPCSSYVLEYLSEYFDITALYYNPNIWPESEYEKRYGELRRLCSEMGLPGVAVTDTGYDENEFLSAVEGLENEREGGARCEKCFILRLFKTAEICARDGYDFFTTTLSISPHKNAELLNKTGEAAAEKYGCRYLHGDFKKRGGFDRSLALSEQYRLYRQDYCGCRFSKAESGSGWQG